MKANKALVALLCAVALLASVFIAYALASDAVNRLDVERIGYERLSERLLASSEAGKASNGQLLGLDEEKTREAISKYESEQKRVAAMDIYDIGERITKYASGASVKIESVISTDPRNLRIAASGPREGIEKLIRYASSSSAWQAVSSVSLQSVASDRLEATLDIRIVIMPKESDPEASRRNEELNANQSQKDAGLAAFIAGASTPAPGSDTAFQGLFGFRGQSAQGADNAAPRPKATMSPSPNASASAKAIAGEKSARTVDFLVYVGEAKTPEGPIYLFKNLRDGKVLMLSLTQGQGKFSLVSVDAKKMVFIIKEGEELYLVERKEGEK